MAKPKRGKLNPLENISEEGFIGYVAEEEQPTSTVQVQEFPIERILDSPFQTREHVSPDAFRRLVYSIKTLGFQGFIPVRRHPEQEDAVQIVAGGHTRREAAKEAGLTTLPIVIVQFTDEQTAYGTVFENEARTGLDPVERGKLYLLLREKLGYSQEALAQKIETTRDIIKECEAAAKSADDIQAMLRLLHKDGKGGEKSGVRAAKALRRLDALDDPEQGRNPGRAAQERAPIISAFLSGELTTNGLEKTVDAVLQQLTRWQEEITQPPSTASVMPSQDGALHPVQEQREEYPTDLTFTPLATIEHEVEAQPVAAPSTAQVHKQRSQTIASPIPVASVPVAQTLAHGTIRRVEQVEDASKRFQRYKRSLGSEPPQEEECAILQTMLQDIQQLLERVEASS